MHSFRVTTGKLAFQWLMRKLYCSADRGEKAETGLCKNLDILRERGFW